MLSNIGNRRSVPPRDETERDGLGREILIDVATAGIGTGLVVLAIVLAAQSFG
jgi:hypothetical protein